MDAVEKLEKLQKRQIYIGTSSWRYPGWKGRIYLHPYTSEREFNERCLEEYALTYPTVGVDHTYYTWPVPEMFEKYARQTPPHFKFGLKVTEKITVFQYPKLKRYGKEAGTRNGAFLSAKECAENFLRPLEGVKSKLGPLMLEFTQFRPGMLESGADFTRKVDEFFSDLKPGNDFQFAIELRNSNWLKAPYFEMLEKHRVAHVFNSWTRMPSLKEQNLLTKEVKFPCIVSRVLLQKGTKYEEAVEAFSPYDKIIEPQPELRVEAANLIERAMDLGIPAFVFVNNRAEGCAPDTIEGILSQMQRDY